VVQVLGELARIEEARVTPGAIWKKMISPGTSSSGDQPSPSL
jgi:hypothetical protein